MDSLVSINNTKTRSRISHTLLVMRLLRRRVSLQKMTNKRICSVLMRVLELWALTLRVHYGFLAEWLSVIFGGDTRLGKSRITNKVCDIRKHF